MTDFETKDSGTHLEYDSGMRRDSQDGKPRFALMLTKSQPYEEQMLTRYARLLARGAEKYSARNWEEGDSEVELERAQESLLRHAAQLVAGETDEDHAAAVWFNAQAIEYFKWRIEQKHELEVIKQAQQLTLEFHGDVDFAAARDIHRKVLNDWHNRDKSDDLVIVKNGLRASRIREIRDTNQARVDEWAQLAGVEIRDYDGFRDIDTYHQITRSHFLSKIVDCTVSFHRGAPPYETAILAAFDAA